MNRVLNYIIILFAVFANSCQLDEGISEKQGEIFLKFFGSSYEDDCGALAQLSDGSYVFVGSIVNTTNGQIPITNVLVVCTDAYGNKLWQKKMDSLNNGYGVDILVDKDFIYVAATLSSEDNKSNMSVIKLTANGDVVWQKTFVTNSDDVCKSMCLTTDGGVVLVGTTINVNEQKNETESANIVISKFSPMGDSLWTRYVGGDALDDAVDIVAKTDGNLLVVANSESFAQEKNQSVILLVELNSFGLTVAMNAIDSVNNVIATSVAINSLNEFVVVGNSTNQATSNSAVFYFADLYNQKWSDFGHDGMITKIYDVVMNDEYIYVSGSFAQELGGELDAALFRFDVVGNYLSKKILGGDGAQQIKSIYLTNDSGFGMLGTSQIDNNTMISFMKISSFE